MSSLSFPPCSVCSIRAEIHTSSSQPATQEEEEEERKKKRKKEKKKKLNLYTHKSERER
jgi:7-keto-8-aminopelargonate synthetase-like enzyme